MGKRGERRNSLVHKKKTIRNFRAPLSPSSTSSLLLYYTSYAALRPRGTAHCALELNYNALYVRIPTCIKGVRCRDAYGCACTRAHMCTYAKYITVNELDTVHALGQLHLRRIHISLSLSLPPSLSIFSFYGTAAHVCACNGFVHKVAYRVSLSLSLELSKLLAVNKSNAIVLQPLSFRPPREHFFKSATYITKARRREEE